MPPIARRIGWLAGGALAIAAAVVIGWYLVRAARPDGPRAVIERSGDGLRIRYPGDRAAIWLYRDDLRLVACSRMELDAPSPADATCMLTAAAALIELEGLTTATYHVVTVQTELRAPPTLAAARALLIRADVPYQDRALIVE